MKILDRYILQRYIGTFSILLLLFIPIGIMIDVSEKIDKFKDQEVPADEIIAYYLDFTVYFANLLYPIFLFLSVIWFTSKLANNSEVIAIMSTGISFRRFLRPYFVGATIVFLIAFLMSIYLAPVASSGYHEFRYKYTVRKSDRITTEVFQQINDNEYIYVSNYDPIRQSADNFVLEHFDGNKLKFKIKSNYIRWEPNDSVFRLSAYTRRNFTETGETYSKITIMDTIFDFAIEDLAPVNYVAETMPIGELRQFIELEKERGSVLINNHLLALHRRWSIPVSAFILTFIAVAVSSKRRRGGMGLNLAIGISLGFMFVFFDKIFGVLVTKSTFSPIVAAWSPVVAFGILGVYLLNLNLKR